MCFKKNKIIKQLRNCFGFNSINQFTIYGVPCKSKKPGFDKNIKEKNKHGAKYSQRAYVFCPFFPYNHIQYSRSTTMRMPPPVTSHCPFNPGQRYSQQKKSYKIGY